MIYIQIMYPILQLDKLIHTHTHMFLTKTSCFIVVIIPLTNETVDRFRLIKPIGQPIFSYSHVLIPNEQTVDWFIWYIQMVDRFNLKSGFNNVKPNKS
jgi:hypothetical protein